MADATTPRHSFMGCIRYRWVPLARGRGWPSPVSNPRRRRQCRPPELAVVFTRTVPNAASTEVYRQFITDDGEAQP